MLSNKPVLRPKKPDNLSSEAEPEAANVRPKKRFFHRQQRRTKKSLNKSIAKHVEPSLQNEDEDNLNGFEPSCKSTTQNCDDKVEIPFSWDIVHTDSEIHLKFYGVTMENIDAENGKIYFNEGNSHLKIKLLQPNESNDFWDIFFSVVQAKSTSRRMEVLTYNVIECIPENALLDQIGSHLFKNENLVIIVIPLSDDTDECREHAVLDSDHNIPLILH